MMAVEPSNAAAPEKVQEQPPPQYERLPIPQYEWLPIPQYAVVPMDERDGLLAWLRGEFAAANAIIDALCEHLKESGEAGEYEGVIGCVEQRRCNWRPVLHMQQYFSVSNVAYALQQVGVRRRGGTEAAQCSNQMSYEARATNGSVAKPVVDGSAKSTGGEKATFTGSSNVKTDAQSKSIPDRKQVLTAIPRIFVSNEICDGELVNITDGLRLYEELFDHSVVSKLIAEVNDLRVAGRRGQLQGQTFVASRRSMRGHGREMIQFGMHIVDLPHEAQSTDLKIQPIPSLFEDVIERLVAMGVVSDSAKPDCCIIDIFSEGDYMNPQTWPHLFGWPICVLFLTECDMAFGKVMGVEGPGGYKGSLMLSLAPGSMLAFEGKSSDYARHALPSRNRERIYVTFTKSLGASPPGRSPSHMHHPKKYAPVPASGSSVTRPVLQPPSAIPQRFVAPAVASPVPAACPVLQPPTAIPQRFVAPAIPSPVPASGVLTSSNTRPVLQSPTAAPQKFVAPAMSAPVAVPSRLPVPGTGVFLPPSGSGKSLNQSRTLMPINGNSGRQTLAPRKMNIATPKKGEKLHHHD